MARVAQHEVEKPYADRDAFQTLLPMTSEGRIIFGPYIFISFDIELDYWEPLNGVRGISRLLPVGLPNPLALPELFMTDLQQRLGCNGFDEKQAEDMVYSYAKGEVAIVTSGAWENHSGKFVRRRKGFINLELLLFNRTIEIPIPAHQVRPAVAKAA